MKDHIKVLEELAGPLGLHEALRPALRAAIDLMNAAKFLDDAAEREHCERAATHARNYGRDSTALVIEADKAVELRAQARAEGYAQGAARYQAAQITLSNQLSAAQAEVAQLRTELQTTKPTWYVQNKLAETEAQLSAAQAEIERLRGVYAKRCGEIEALETKLTNLRVAAERAESLLGESEIAWHLRAMIEASR